MALKIQLRRDTAANWTTNNPLLLNGEIGIETDTLKFKIGNGSQRWNAIQFYAFRPGAANGVASLDSSGKVPVSQLPAFVNLQELEQSIEDALSSASTSDIQEGINLYFTNARAISALEGIYDPVGSASQAIIVANQNTTQKISDLIDSAPQILDTFNELAIAIQSNENYVDDVVNLVANKQNILTAGQGITIDNSNIYVTPNTYDTKGSAASAEQLAATDATNKSNVAKSEAIAAAALDATGKANSAKSEAIAAAAADATTKLNNAISAAETDATNKANLAIAAASLDATGKANAAESAAILSASIDSEEKDLVVLENANSHAEGFINSVVNLLTTSDIEEGTSLYFTENRAKQAVASDIADAIAAIPNGGASITSTSQLPEGANLYFTNARAISATNSARTNVLVSALTAVDDLRTEINASLTNYILLADRNIAGGVAGLNVNGQIEDSYLSSSIARTSQITSAVADLVNLAPDSLNTLGELAAAFQNDQSGISALVATVSGKLDSSLASTTYSSINSPTFTGTVTIPAGALISGYATTINLSNALTQAEEYTDLAIQGINNSLGDYVPESERNQNNGYAGLDSSGKILVSAVPVISNSMLQNNSITINGSAISLGSSVITGYTNGVSGSNVNKISYGTSATPPSSGNSAGDIYIQY